MGKTPTKGGFGGKAPEKRGGGGVGCKAPHIRGFGGKAPEKDGRKKISDTFTYESSDSKWVGVQKGNQQQ